jgi:hypothetical protein
MTREYELLAVSVRANHFRENFWPETAGPALLDFLFAFPHLAQAVRA